MAHVAGCLRSTDVSRPGLRRPMRPTRRLCDELQEVRPTLSAPSPGSSKRPMAVFSLKLGENLPLCRVFSNGQARWASALFSSTRRTVSAGRSAVTLLARRPLGLRKSEQLSAAGFASSSRVLPRSPSKSSNSWASGLAVFEVYGTTATVVNSCEPTRRLPGTVGQLAFHWSIASLMTAKFSSEARSYSRTFPGCGRDAEYGDRRLATHR